MTCQTETPTETRTSMPQLIFDEATHTYTLDGVILPSVTEVCKPLTVDIAEKAKPWLRDAAARRGTAIHELCAEIDMQGNADEIPVPPEYAGYIQAYLGFLRDYQIRSWLAIEMPIAHGGLGVAGTIDRLGIIDGTLTIVDIKTGTRIDKAFLAAQIAGYFLILHENGFEYPFITEEISRSIHKNGVRTTGVQLMKDGKYRIYPCPATPLFHKLLDIYNERRRINGK